MALIYTNGTTWHVGHGYLRSDHDDQIENLQPEDLSAEQPEHLSEEQTKDLTEEPPRRFEIRGHLVHGIPKKGDPNYEPLCGRCNPDLDGNDSVVDVTVSMASEQSSDDEDSAANPGGHNQNNEPVRAAPRRYMGRVAYTTENISVEFHPALSFVFIAGEMAGVGMLATPWAVINLGWMGFIMLISFGIATAYSASCLSYCWQMVEERHPQTYPVADPFPMIALHAVGRRTSIFTRLSVQLTLFGSATVYLILIAQCAQKLLSNTHSEVDFSTWLFVFSISLSALMFLESPHDYYIVAIGAMLTTMTAAYFILLQILLDERIKEGTQTVSHVKNFSANQFFFSFGSILFSYGGALCFPVLPTGMFKRAEFSRSVITSFMILAILFGAVVTASYVVYGKSINPNILMSLGDSWLSYSAIVLMAGHLILGFVIIARPLSQQVELFFNTPNSFNFKRFIVRVCILISMIAISKNVPDFTNLVALIGCSTVIMITFVLPSIFYLRLSSARSIDWPERNLSWKCKFYMYTIIIVGLTCVAAAMFTAIVSLIPPSYFPNIYFENTYSR